MKETNSTETEAEVEAEVETAAEPEEPYFKSYTLYPAKSRFNTRKTISLKHDRDLTINVFADYAEGNSIKLAQYNITNITDI